MNNNGSVMATTKSIEVEMRDRVACVFLNRADRLNACVPEMVQRLTRTLESLDRTRGVRVIVLAGRGEAFCAGQDLEVRRPSKRVPASNLGAVLMEAFNPLIVKMRAVEVPILAALHGIVAGPGLGIAAASDIVLADERTRFVLEQVRIGLAPEAGITWLLPRIIGVAATRALAMTGEPFTASEAQRLGLVWRVTEPGRVLDEAIAQAESLASRPPRSLMRIKQMLEVTAVASLEEQLQVEANIQRELGRTDDYREGLLAFLEGRNPVFRGR